ncbi:DotA/TraY family protein (plasmid) [Methylomarinum sp. Ch1-1]|uniref:DotA/TraY family protein n=1 Tax=Methylomarinum roseum TaxID=3067653 RepID=A0AAU7P0R1_9GAMM
MAGELLKEQADNTVQAATTAKDDAHNMLSSIFGENWDTLYNGTPSGDSAWTVVFEIFAYVNSGVLLSVAVLFVYVMGVGVIGTAHEGETLGKRYSTLWTPIRSAFALAMLAPIPGVGISVVQALVLLMISVGSHVSNTIWSKSVTYMAKHGGQMVATLPDNMKENARDMMKGILKSEATQVYLARMNKYKMSGPVYSEEWISNKDGKSGTYFLWFKPSPKMAHLKEKIGNIKIDCHEQSSQLCSARISATRNAIGTLFPAANEIVNGDGAPHVNTLNNAVIAYERTVASAVKSTVNLKNPGYRAALTNFAETASEKGWVHAGAWFWTISGLQETAADTINNQPVYVGPDVQALEVTAYNDYSTVIGVVDGFDDIAAKKTQMAARTPQTTSRELNGEPSSVLDKMSNVINSNIGFERGGFVIVDALTEGDPISNMRSIGSFLINSSYGIIGSYLGITFAVNAGYEMGSSGIWGKAANFFTFNGAKGLLAGTKAVVNELGSFVIAATLPIFILALFLTYYLPSIPFILWMSAVAGWLILVCETVVAAPIWAAAHAIPEGEGIAGQHGKQGYMLFLNVLLRPMLMVVGLLFGFVLILFVSKLLGEGLEIFFLGLNAETFIVGPMTFLAMLTITGLILIVLTHKMFGLITHLPENTMRWIGGGGQQLGEQQDESRMRAIFAAAVHQGSGGLKRGPTPPGPGGAGLDEAGEESGLESKNKTKLENDLEQGSSRESPSSGV